MVDRSLRIRRADGSETVPASSLALPNPVEYARAGGTQLP